MTPDQKHVVESAATLGYLIFAASIAVNPVLWPLGALIALKAAREDCK